MRKLFIQFSNLLLIIFLAACSSTPTSTTAPTVEAAPVETMATEGAVEAAGPTTPANCPVTPADMEGPFYTPDAPERDKVGEGYIISGVVRSVEQCSPIPAAKIEIWMAGPDGEYGDDYRATLYAGEDGAYRFESAYPPPYDNRPPHIHIKVSAAGYGTLITQHYPRPGNLNPSFDLVLQPVE